MPNKRVGVFKQIFQRFLSYRRDEESALDALLDELLKAVDRLKFYNTLKDGLLYSAGMLTPLLGFGNAILQNSLDEAADSYSRYLTQGFGVFGVFLVGGAAMAQRYERSSNERVQGLLKTLADYQVPDDSDFIENVVNYLAINAILTQAKRRVQAVAVHGYSNPMIGMEEGAPVNFRPQAATTLSRYGTFPTGQNGSTPDEEADSDDYRSINSSSPS